MMPEMEFIEEEWGWRKKQRVSEFELTMLFPEAIEAVLYLIPELEKDKNRFLQDFAQRLESIAEDRLLTEDQIWFWLTVAKYCSSESLQLRNTQRNLDRLYRLRWLYKPWPRSDQRRVTQEEIETARQRSIAEIASPYLQKIRKSGANLVALCPFHLEKTPSFYLYSEHNRFHCFGCEERGDTIAFIRKIQNCSFVEAVKQLI